MVGTVGSPSLRVGDRDHRNDGARAVQPLHGDRRSSTTGRSIKPAYRVVARGRHGADREWRSPVPHRARVEARRRRRAGRARRPHLTHEQRTRWGSARSQSSHCHGADYRRGYLLRTAPRRCARLASYSYERPGRTRRRRRIGSASRLPIVEALDRARRGCSNAPASRHRAFVVPARDGDASVEMQRDPDVSTRAASSGSREIIALARRAARRLVQGLPRRHLRRRGFLRARRRCGSQTATRSCSRGRAHVYSSSASMPHRGARAVTTG